jgi:hypothetical protein
MKQETGLVNDVAELKLYEAILHGESWAVTFCLRTKGRHRGYGDKAEVAVTGVTLQIVEEIVDAPSGNDPQDEPDAPGPT